MKRSLFIAIAFALVLSACGSMAATPEPSFVAGAPAPQMPEMALDMPADSVANQGISEFDKSANTGAAGADAAAVERLVIQDANLSIVVADPIAKMDEIQKMAEHMGGFVVSSDVNQVYTDNNVKVPQGNITVRVPAERLNEALDQIKAETVEVLSESRSGKDVTSDYIDLQSRLKTHQDAADQLTKILAEKTESSEVLDVFNQLVYHREQIEKIKGQMKYYEEAAALSAIYVQVAAEETLQPLEIAGWKPVGVARDALQSLINFFQGFVNFIIWLIILIIPAGLLILVLLWLIWKVFRFAWRKLFPNRGKKKAEEPTSENA